MGWTSSSTPSSSSSRSTAGGGSRSQSCRSSIGRRSSCFTPSETATASSTSTDLKTKAPTSSSTWPSTSVARVSYTVTTDVSPQVVWDALTEFGPRRAELWPDLSPSSFKVLERGETWARVREGTAGLGIWSIERYEWKEPVITATVEEANAAQTGWDVAHGGEAAEWRGFSADHQHGSTREGHRGPPHSRAVPDHQRPLPCRPDTAHAFESPWVDLLRAEADG